MKKLILISTAVMAALAVQAKTYELQSPDGRNLVTVNADNNVSYSLTRDGNPILDDSPVSLTVDGKQWGTNAKCRKAKKSSADKTLSLVVPRRHSTLKDKYNALTLSYGPYSIEFRAYDDGMAYRFISDSPKADRVTDEVAGYNLAGDPNLHVQVTDRMDMSFEGLFDVRPVSSMPTDSVAFLPLVADQGKYKVVLCEAGVYDYPGIFLKGENGKLRSAFANYPADRHYAFNHLQYIIDTRKDFMIEKAGRRKFPWRITAVFDNDRDLMGNDLVYILGNDTDAEGDYSWVKPGKVLWEWWNAWNLYGQDVPFRSGVNTDYYKWMVDYAKKLGVEYMLIDEGWSSKEDLLDTTPGCDIAEICRYANEKGVGIILWVSYANMLRNTTGYLDQIEKWGAKGVKMDFMDRNDAEMVDFYELVADECARRHLLLNYHGAYPPDGMRRRYPNIMTREGVRGNEYNKWSNDIMPKHNLNLAYIRQFAGPMDYTPGGMLNTQPERFRMVNEEPMVKGTRSHQVAMYVLYDSPLQMMCDSPNNYEQNPVSRDFIAVIPTTWDETVPLEGKLGEYVAVARRHGDKWYIGAMNGTDAPVDLNLDLSFIGPEYKNITYHADGPNSDLQAKDAVVRNVKFDSRMLPVKMVRNGGYAAVITK